MSENLISVVDSLTMSSREIADLTGKEHAHVMRDVRTMFDGLEMAHEGYIQNWRHPQNGQLYEEFALPKDLTLTLVSGYSVKLRKAIIDRWQNLERAASNPAPTFNIPTTLAGALRLAAEQAERIEKQDAQIEAAKPAIEFVDRYVKADGPKGVRQVCQLLNANEREFVQFLIDAGIMYRLDGALAPMACHRHTGRFVVKAGVNRETEHAFNQAKFTPKGVEWIAGEWGKYMVDLNQRALQPHSARMLSCAHH